MLKFIRATGDKDKPEATLRSFVNQVYESVHRHAKLNWAWRNGQHAFSLQHDGVGIGCDAGRDPTTMAMALTQEITATCGYPLRVEAKNMAHRRPQTKDYVWPKRRTTAFEGDSYVLLTPTGTESRLKEALITVLQNNASRVTVEQDVIMLSEHNTTNGELFQRAARASRFQVDTADDARGSAEVMWCTGLMREASIMAARGYMWVGETSNRGNLM